ncbi:hypothetical protein BDQ17DRAFT_1376998 [Cyathus striatus]|nr:hypothetical protein BDQ17DRAFT_1376998 [Cyathus striatus]
MSSGSMQSNVGGRQTHEANEQRLPKQSERSCLGRANQESKYSYAPPNAHHDLDSKDQRTLKNQLSAASKNQREAEAFERQSFADPSDALKPAKSHGNEPSRGAKKDARLCKMRKNIWRGRARFEGRSSL